MLYAKITDVTIGFTNGALTASLTSPTTITALTASYLTDDVLTWASSDTKTIDVIFTVTSKDKTKYPANDPKVLEAFGAGKLIVSVYSDKGGNANTKPISLATDSITCPTAAEASSTAETATYKITITLDNTFAQSAYETYVADNSAVDSYQAKFALKLTDKEIPFDNAVEFTVGYSSTNTNP